MHFVVHAPDKPDALSRREAALTAPRAYLDVAPGRHGITVLLSGPMTSDDGGRMVGSFFLLDAPDRTSVEAMFAEDPLAAADVWATCTITAVHLRQNRMGAS